MSEQSPGPADARRFAPSTQRNREPILAVLRRVLPATGLVLEVASGSGEHAVFFAAALPQIAWQPSDPDADSRASIAAWTGQSGVANVRTPLALDVTDESWPLQRADALVSINMVHIAPWAACPGLMRGAGRLLTAGAPLYLYGPFHRGGRPTAASNEAFDRGLRAQNPAWGVRDLEAVAEEAARHGLALDEIVEMPSNNFSLVFRKRP
jgi:uncharacterized protein DUF938